MARQLRMVRPSLEDLPALELPAGYGMRTYHKGDEAHWGPHHQRLVRWQRTDRAGYRE